MNWWDGITHSGPIVVGVDPANKMGMCFSSVEGVPITWGLVDVTPKKDDKEGDRWGQLWWALKGILSNPKIVQMYYEEVMFHNNVASAHVYGSIRAILTMASSQLCIPYSGVNVSTAKRIFTGNGQASKKQVAAEARHKWGHDLGWTTKNTDPCDAASIAWAGLHGKKE